MAPVDDQKDPCEASKSPTPVLRVTYVLAYRAPRYIRTESMLSALLACPHVELSVARNTRKGPLRYVDTWNTLRRMCATNTSDVYVLGFRGHEFFWPLRWLIKGKPLIFDALMSPYAALRDEHKGSPIRRMLASLIYPLERNALQHADLVLTDTKLQAQFYARTFGLPLEKFCPVPVGAIESMLSRNLRIPKSDAIFSVLFYGSFLPLHGINFIIEAAAKLVDLPIRFDFIGGSKVQITRLRRRCENLGVTKFSHRPWVAFDQLLKKDIPEADLCLGGPFGGTPQAHRVVTGKTSQCLALGKVTVVGRIEEDGGFVDHVNCLLVKQADADALAASIRWAYAHRADLPGIGDRGRKLFEERSATAVIAARLSEALQRLTDIQVDASPRQADEQRLT